jgi:hypothetical protein
MDNMFTAKPLRSKPGRASWLFLQDDARSMPALLFVVVVVVFS